MTEEFVRPPCSCEEMRGTILGEEWGGGWRDDDVKDLLKGGLELLGTRKFLGPFNNILGVKFLKEIGPLIEIDYFTSFQHGQAVVESAILADLEMEPLIRDELSRKRPPVDRGY
ncbi:hypothetical protein AMTR_s00052p00212670 [Amborella trichopoda]|uniref:Uncharacterized protein n=1 Tax=Amborella trichopoda TaxID=13333 RepID=U5D220_AMBTC|nr:hypothetical protein AMTR_s00052p00212670 [Amborella trichopoda]